jgi:hypothetical protein
MAKCVYCGESTGFVGGKAHDSCITESLRVAPGGSESAPTSAVNAASAPVPVVRMATIIGGVFWGMMLFSAVTAILWLFVRWWLTLV